MRIRKEKVISHTYLETWVPELYTSNKHLETVEFGEKLCFKIEGIRKSAFWLAILATPIDSAYLMHNAYRHVVSPHAHNY